MKFDALKVRKILIISLSNIGDCVLTFPVIDILKEHFPQSEVSIVVGPKAQGLFKGNPHFKEIYIFDKHAPMLKQMSWVLNLRKEHFDLAVDLRHTAIPILIGAKYRTPLIKTKSEALHKRFHHLARLKAVVDFKKLSPKRFCLRVEQNDEQLIDQIIKLRIDVGQKFVILSPGAADQSKRWSEENFAALADRLISDHQFKVVFVGDNLDAALIRRILGKMRGAAIDFSGQITLTQLAQLLQMSSLVIANDSAVMHMASYLDLSVVALFGPTDPKLYGPWSSKSVVLRNNAACPKCLDPKSDRVHDCLTHIPVNEVLSKISNV